MDLKAILCAVKQKLHYQVTYFQQKRTQSWDEFSLFLKTLHLFLIFFNILATILFFRQIFVALFSDTISYKSLLLYTKLQTVDGGKKCALLYYFSRTQPDKR